MAKRAETSESHAPRINCTDHGMMMKVFLGGVEWYLPVLVNHRMDDEGGVTDISVRNIKKIVTLYGPPNLVLYHNGSSLWSWDNVWYVATGFGIGYGGEGPSKFAQLLDELKMVNPAGQDWRRWITSLPSDYWMVAHKEMQKAGR